MRINYFYNIYTGWKKGVPSDLYWPFVWKSTKSFWTSVIVGILGFPLFLVFAVFHFASEALGAISTGVRKLAEFAFELSGLEKLMDSLNKDTDTQGNKLRDWYRANGKMRKPR